MEEPEFYRRRLPHWQPKGATFAITFHLDGSLPMEKFTALKKEHQSQPRTFHKAAWDNYFQKIDELIANNSSSPKWLAEPVIAQEVAKALHYWHDKSYRLIAYCIMSNHVHLMLDEAQRPLFRILQSIKRHTARQANILLNRTNETFWQKESYDHMVRDEMDFQHQLNYLLRNPIKAQLVHNWQDYAFAYLNPAFKSYLVSGAE